jgi:hypothetical protein
MSGSLAVAKVLRQTMPPTTRLPTVQFRSLLSPPIRIRLQTLYNFVRPQCATAPLGAPCLAQRRSLHLYKTAKATTALGMHKVLFFDRYHPTPPSESKHKVNLVASTTDRRVIAEGLSLQELYDNHVDHGKILYMVDPVLKKVDGSLSRLQENNVQSSNNNFALLAAGSVPFNIKNSQKARKQHHILTLKSARIHAFGARPLIPIHFTWLPGRVSYPLEWARPGEERGTGATQQP